MNFISSENSGGRENKDVFDFNLYRFLLLRITASIYAARAKFPVADSCSRLGAIEAPISE